MAQKWILSFCFVIVFPLQSFSQYYTFQEEVNQPSWLDPMKASYQVLQQTVNLLKWRFSSEARPLPPIKYDRLAQFGTWIKDPRSSSCLNTRAKVLARDSQSQVGFAETNPCRVATGTWNDPYSGSTFTNADDVQIDHVVALKNAYDSGAYNWSNKYRCLYTNFMAYKNHLLSVSGVENNRKSDKGPERWMPSNSRFACQHLQNWLAVKFLWKMNMSEAESKSIAQFVSRYRCAMEMFQANQVAIMKMRNAIQRDVAICQ